MELDHKGMAGTRDNFQQEDRNRHAGDTDASPQKGNDASVDDEDEKDEPYGDLVVAKDA